MGLTLLMHAHLTIIMLHRYRDREPHTPKQIGLCSQFIRDKFLYNVLASGIMYLILYQQLPTNSNYGTSYFH